VPGRVTGREGHGEAGGNGATRYLACRLRLLVLVLVTTTIGVFVVNVLILTHATFATSLVTLML
jgi:hypothetical protein